MVRSLVGWIPNEANWRLQWVLKTELEKRCKLRNIATNGLYKNQLQEILSYYGNGDEFEKRAWFWFDRPPDCMSDAYAKSLKLAESNSFQVIEVEDLSCEDQGNFVKKFTLTSFKAIEGQPSLFDVFFGNYLMCSCRGPITLPAPTTFPSLEHCVHTIYIMRHVLNCPELYRWQVSFLSSERESLLYHSVASYIIRDRGWDVPNTSCTLCFKNLHRIHKTSRGTCQRCGRQYHTSCFSAAKREREPAKDGECYMCLDRDKWGLEQYREKPNVRPKVADAAKRSKKGAKPKPAVEAAKQKQSRRRTERRSNNKKDNGASKPDAPEADAAQSSSDEDEDTGTLTCLPLVTRIVSFQGGTRTRGRTMTRHRPRK